MAQPQQFMAQERTIVEEAYAGDIIGIFDPGIFRIGDSLCEGEAIAFDGIPSFSPEHFARVGIRDAMTTGALINSASTRARRSQTAFSPGRNLRTQPLLTAA